MTDRAGDQTAAAADLVRRFTGTRRLYGDAAVDAFAGASACVVGIGGVGSWAAEALARSAVGALTLIDLDMVAESNVNRQIHALSGVFGAAKVDVMAARIHAINPACAVSTIEDFVTVDNAETVLARRFSVVVDAIDDAPAKVALIAACRRLALPLVTVGGAGGRRDPTKIRCEDLARSAHDPLLARVRRELRREHGFPPTGHFGIRAIFSAEAMSVPTEAACEPGSRLACSGYGSAVAVTGAFGFAAAAEALRLITARPAS
jgi:tRNA A37 threonylcarbamoyladenosine dehydratase